MIQVDSSRRDDPKRSGFSQFGEDRALLYCTLGRVVSGLFRSGQPE